MPTPKETQERIAVLASVCGFGWGIFGLVAGCLAADPSRGGVEWLYTVSLWLSGWSFRLLLWSLTCWLLAAIWGAIESR